MQQRIDPLAYCAHHFGLGNAETWRRAAHWAGYGFVTTLPAPPPLPEPVARLDRLGELRSIRLIVASADRLFVAPHFAQVIQLAQRRDDGLAGSIAFAPPEAIERAIAIAASDQLMDNARQRISLLWPAASAADLPRHVRAGFAIFIVAVICLAMLAGVVFRPFLIPVVALALMAPGLLRFIAALPAATPREPPPLPDAELPVYSILIPLRDEAQMVPLLHRAMSQLDYPAHLLDIKFVVEAKSPATVRAVEATLADPRFRLIVVPPGPPHTKPKALDYALPLARGEFVVVYDAEDVPDADQLRRAATLFRADPGLACLQAELVPENGHENALTALFAGEYAGLFSRLLPALARWRLPMPLGGTSNHFRTSVLRDIGGWDAFNVTEDADLGVRLARRGQRAETFASETHEEAPLTLPAWTAQRTRWMKGWMQTYCVHGRTPRALLRDLGWRGFLGFHVLVGGMIVSSLLHTMFLSTLFARVVFEGPGALVPVDVWDFFALAIIGAGYGGAVALTLSGLVHQRSLHLAPYQLLLPAYWLLHSVATLLATIELLTAPTHWSKTRHGVTRLERRSTEEEEAVGE